MKQHDKRGILKTYFGYDEFRPGQEAVIDAILSGRDVLAIMPTGAGKSLCYQIPALMLPGMTVVISPLISLMKDQVNALEESGAAAAFLNSSLSQEEYFKTIRAVNKGECRILYIAPERLGGEIKRIAETVAVSLVVIDEAHCVSQWGHDFRPSYTQIADFIASLPNRPVAAAFTATATAKVKADILSTLGLVDPFAITTGFDRQNLYFAVQKPKDKAAALLEYLEKNKRKSGIVYCATRKTVEEVTAELTRQGYEATRYHAGLDDGERRGNQDDFLYDRKTIMVATNAFGMGIDKSNVSFVIHYNMPKNIESYYQEAGRAGRDGERAECVLFYGGKDVQTNKFLIENGGDENVERDDELIRHNLDLLKAMTFYATGTDCLRSRLLAYFGETAPSFCGNCSNCNTLFEERDITVESQKIISCVFRLAQRNRRFGKSMIVNILRGSKDKKITTLHLDTLSTYGIMQDTNAHQIRVILDFLVDNGYLEVEAGEYPVITAAPKSREIITEKKALSMMLPKDMPKETPKSALASRENAADGPLEEQLFEKLRELRAKFAREEQVPAYIVFSDASLRDMCRKKPATVGQFLNVIGVGEKKLERYGNAFIEVILQIKG
jgi:ATP-dependent DNA helicase RecQ